MSVTFTVDDEGKRVVDTNGTEIGTVDEIGAGIALVEPGPGLSESVKARLSRDRAVTDGMERYQLDEDHVDEITVDEVRLQRL